MIRRFQPARLLLLAGLFFMASHGLWAQSVRTPSEIALRFLQENPTKFELSAADVADVKVVREYASQHDGTTITHVWVQQQFAGIPLFNGVFGLHVRPNGEVAHLGHRFQADLGHRINTQSPSLSAYKALEMAMANLGFTGFTTPSLREKINDRNFVFQGGAISKTDIPVSICFFAQPDGKVRLAWTMVIDQANTADLWIMQVDAQTGLILNKANQTLYCKAGNAHRIGEVCHDVQPETATALTLAPPPPPNAPESYNVFALPTESPAHGPRQLVVNPADPVASPFGWHDTNGQAGAEYTYSRGNNVWAYDDAAKDNTATIGESVDGGAGLVFDFTFDPNAEPNANRDAAITNLFYINNMMHDITYKYGFDAQAGNFQTNNYGAAGVAGDAVQAEAFDGSGLDNANFSTPADGGSGRMQMFLWSRQGGKNLTVNAPGSILGSYNAAAAGFGKAISTTAVTGNVVVVNDGSSDGTLGCDPLTNNVSGKIALIDRGVCEFGRKALNAQQAGAIGCIICNYEDAVFNMGPGAVGGQVTIPVVGMTKSDCALLRQFAGTTLNVSLVQPSNSGPNQLDGSFDNGIVAHEYGHGISNRLTGQGFGCLSNTENMGEGWSDFFALVTTVSPGDFAAKKQGMGTYVFRQNNDGQGIRRYPYSTDMSINPITFSTVAENTETHALGEVWTAVLWDLYWAMVDKYGFDASLDNHTSGNGRAIQLVMDGMKLQPCSPGFIDGRDAILLADELYYDNVDTCLIMNVFARRGMGIKASQGDSDQAADGTESFDPIPTCLKTLKISKICSPIVNPGETATFSITITNHKDNAVPGVVVSDELSNALTFISASNGGVYSNGKVVWNVGTMPSGQVKVLTYQAKFVGNGSARLFRDELETDVQWLAFFSEGNNVFALQTDTVKTGTKAWEAPSIETETDMTLAYDATLEITGAKPTLRFWHQYQTERAADAGFIEVQYSDLSLPQNWQRFAPEKVIRNGYPTKVQYGTFAIPYLNGFSGDSKGWVQSYFDMSDYIGKTLNFRFRFGTDANTTVPNAKWIVDDLELLDLINFDGEATVTSTEGDLATAKAPEKGVIINPGAATGTDDPTNNALAIDVQPNPASDFLRLSVAERIEGPVRISLTAVDGRTPIRLAFDGLNAHQTVQMDIQRVPAGVYTVRLESNTGYNVTKVVIQ